MQHRELIATAFRVGGLLIGIPSLVAFAYFGYGAVSLYWSHPELPPAYKTGVQPMDLAISCARAVGKVFSFFGGAMEWALAAISVLCFGLLAFAVLLYFTGRGLHAGHGLARAAGIGLAILPFLVSLMVLMATRKVLPLTLCAAVLGLSGYVIWALGWRFAG